jgi:eukaryotic-like serine/threonine-protein kinase
MAQSQANTESIFWEALALETPDERARFLDEACGGDAALRGQIEEMLRAHPQAEQFLEAPAPRCTSPDASRPLAR